MTKMASLILPKKMIHNTARRNTMKKSFISKKWRQNHWWRVTSSTFREISTKDQRMFRMLTLFMRDSRPFADSKVENFRVDKSSVLLLQEHSLDSLKYFFWTRQPLLLMKIVRRRSKMLSIKLEKVVP
jgi:hypothetical protein